MTTEGDLSQGGSARPKAGGASSRQAGQSPVNRIVIRMSGGVIQGASADDPSLKVIVIDDDELENGEPHPLRSEDNCARVLSLMTPVY